MAASFRLFIMRPAKALALSGSKIGVGSGGAAAARAVWVAAAFICGFLLGPVEAGCWAADDIDSARKVLETLPSQPGHFCHAMTANSPITVALLALPEATTSTLYGLFDLFRSVSRDTEPTGRGANAAPFNPLLVAPISAAFESDGGVHIQPHGDLSLVPSPDIICIPSLRPAKKGVFAERYPQVVDSLRQQNARGAVTASACTGSFLLAESGLLNDRRRRAGCRLRRGKLLSGDCSAVVSVFRRWNIGEISKSG